MHHHRQPPDPSFLCLVGHRPRASGRGSWKPATSAHGSCRRSHQGDWCPGTGPQSTLCVSGALSTSLKTSFLPHKPLGPKWMFLLSSVQQTFYTFRPLCPKCPSSRHDLLPHSFQMHKLYPQSGASPDGRLWEFPEDTQAPTHMSACGPCLRGLSATTWRELDFIPRHNPRWKPRPRPGT